MTCQDCTRDKSKTLINGSQACTWCEAWRMECEAAWILKTFPTTRRSKHHPLTVRDWLEQLQRSRGAGHVARLREVMAALWRRNRA